MQRYMPNSDGVVPDSVKTSSVFVLELSAGVLIPGAKSWNDVIQISEHQEVYRLFLFLIDVCVNLTVAFGIEVLALDTSVPLDRFTRPVGYRIWIPLNSDAANAFRRRITSTLSSAHHGKRRRTVGYDGLPHLKPVRQMSDFINLIQMYTGSYPASDPMSKLEVVEYFNRSAKVAVSPLQECPTSYVNGDVFSPHPDLVRRGFYQLVTTGPAGAVRESGYEWPLFMLPMQRPSKRELVAKYNRIDSAVGRTPRSYDGMSIPEMMKLRPDPGEFSPIMVITPDYRRAGLTQTIESQYWIMESIAIQNKHRMESLKGPDEWLAFYRDTAREMEVILSPVSTPGVPLMYNKLHNESDWDMSDESAEMWAEHRGQDKRGYTPASYAITWIALCGQECLGLMIPQLRGFIPAWLRTFSVTSLYIETSPNYIFTGVNGSGKSKLVTTIGKCLAKSLVTVVNTKTLGADSGANSVYDLGVTLTEEYKFLVGSNALIEQERISSGVSSHLSQKKDVHTGVWTHHFRQSLNRWATFASTNFQDKVVPAILDRSCCMPINPDFTSSTPHSVVASSDNPQFKSIREGWEGVLRKLSSAQYGYSFAEATGFPDIDYRCFELFWGMLETTLGRQTIPVRRTVDIKDLAHSIMVWNMIRTWHLDGLGEACGYDLGKQMLWYRWGRFVRMEDVCLAYMYLEQSRSVKAQTLDIIRSIKATVLVQNDELVGKGPYWVTTNTSFRETRHLISRLHGGSFGTGACGHVMDTLFTSLTRGKLNIVMDDDDKNVLIHKEWAASVYTSAESRIIKYLYRMAIDGTAHLEYTEEQRYVYRTGRRAELTIPERSKTQPVELDGISPVNIKRAMASLLHRCVSSTETPMIRLEDDIVHVALARDVSPTRFITKPDLYKIKGSEICSMTVHKSLFVGADAVGVVPVDTLIKSALTVAGGYGGKKVVSGVGTDDDTFYYIDPDAKVSMVIDNSRHCSQSVWGPSRAKRETIFPRTATYTVTETTGFEQRVARECRSLFDVSPELAALFTAYGT